MRRFPISAAGNPSSRLLPLATAVALHLGGSASAATIHVNDAGAGSVAGKCTLFDAVAALNGAVAVNGCAAGNGNNDLIDLSFFTTLTQITFAVAGSADGKSALQVVKPASIVAPLDANGQPTVKLQRSTVSGTPAFRLLATSADLTLSGLIISGGSTSDQGGGVFASGNANLTLRDGVVGDSTSTASSGGGVAAECGNIQATHVNVVGNRSYNGGGGVYSSSSSGGMPCSTTITLQNSNVSGNIAQHRSSGAVYSFNGSVIADHSQFQANSAPAIGAIGAYQSVTLTNSTVSDNSVTYGFSGISSATVTLVNTTLTGNQTSDSSTALGTKNLTMYFCTVAYNSAAAGGGGIFFDTHALLVGNIVRGNQSLDFLSSHAATVDGDHNIIKSSVASNQAPVPPDTLDCDPLLGALMDNGGPTMTMAPGAGSCAIDAGPSSPPGTIPSDQRGAKFARRVGAATDIGSFEVQSNDRIFYDGFGA